MSLRYPSLDCGYLWLCSQTCWSHQSQIQRLIQTDSCWLAERTGSGCREGLGLLTRARASRRERGGRLRNTHAAGPEATDLLWRGAEGAQPGDPRPPSRPPQAGSDLARGPEPVPSGSRASRRLRPSPKAPRRGVGPMCVRPAPGRPHFTSASVLASLGPPSEEESLRPPACWAGKPAKTIP